MAKRTLDEYIKKAKAAGGELSSDLNYEETRNIHKNVFDDNNLEMDNWTLDLPMELYRQKYGEAAQERVWQYVRDTGGDGPDAWQASGALYSFVLGVAFSGNSDARRRAWHWLSNTPNPMTAVPQYGIPRRALDYWSCQFNRAKKWIWPRDPIILDLDGDGLQTVGLSGNVYFDHDGDGVLSKTGWVGQGDALLVWDRNANGRIDTGAELFGDFTPLPNGSLAPNGFAALAALDSNGDGVLDASDPAFAQLKLWKDNTLNGQTEAGELITLAEAGISALHLAPSLKNQNMGNGNTLVRQGSFIRNDGSTGDMGEFHLAINTTSSRFAEKITIPEENLPMVKQKQTTRNINIQPISDDLNLAAAEPMCFLLGVRMVSCTRFGERTISLGLWLLLLPAMRQCAGRVPGSWPCCRCRSICLPRQKRARRLLRSR